MNDHWIETTYLVCSRGRRSLESAPLGFPLADILNSAHDAVSETMHGISEFDPAAAYEYAFPSTQSSVLDPYYDEAFGRMMSHTVHDVNAAST